MAPFLHPHLDLPLPDLDDLLARAAPDGQELLVLAARLAARRIAQQDAIAGAIDELTTGPWLDGDLPWSPPPRGELQPTDLLRAVLAARPDLVPALAYFGREDDLDPEPFERACRPWADLRHDLPPAPDSLVLPRWWARRWALFAGELDAAACVQNLGPRGLGHLGSFSKQYVEGLITFEEGEGRVLDRMAAAGRPGNAAPLAPGYLDHFGGLARLGDALVRGAGAVLLGEAGSGRRALLAAFGRRLRERGEPAALRGFGCNVDNFHGGPLLGTAADPDAFLPPAAVDRRMIYGLTPAGFAPALGGEPDPAVLRLVRHCAALARDPDAEFRLVLAASRRELSWLLRLAPDLDALGEVHVLPLLDEDLLAAWLAHAPGVEDRARRRVSLAAITAAIAVRDDDGRRDFSRHDDIVAAVDTYPVRRFERARDAMTADRRHTWFVRRLGGRGLTPEPDRLEELLALERRLLP